jgi:hypothetical protein
MATANNPKAQSAQRRLAKRALQLGFLFFFLKGIGWIAAGWIGWKALR